MQTKVITGSIYISIYIVSKKKPHRSLPQLTCLPTWTFTWSYWFRSFASWHLYSPLSEADAGLLLEMMLQSTKADVHVICINSAVLTEPDSYPLILLSSSATYQWHCNSSTFWLVTWSNHQVFAVNSLTFISWHWQLIKNDIDRILAVGQLTFGYIMHQASALISLYITTYISV